MLYGNLSRPDPNYLPASPPRSVLLERPQNPGPSLPGLLLDALGLQDQERPLGERAEPHAVDANQALGDRPRGRATCGRRNGGDSQSGGGATAPAARPAEAGIPQIALAPRRAGLAQAHPWPSSGLTLPTLRCGALRCGAGRAPGAAGSRWILEAFLLPFFSEKDGPGAAPVRPPNPATPLRFPR